MFVTVTVSSVFGVNKVIINVTMVPECWLNGNFPGKWEQLCSLWKEVSVFLGERWSIFGHMISQDLSMKIVAKMDQVPISSRSSYCKGLRPVPPTGPF